MKRVQRSVVAVCLGAILLVQAGCFGTFQLTKNLYNWNDGVSDNKFVKTLVFWGMSILPVYAIGAFVDVVIFNLIEFWSGSNPLAMEEGDHEMQVVKLEGEKYRIEATQNRFVSTQLTGEGQGTVQVMEFDDTQLQWELHRCGGPCSSGYAVPERGRLRSASVHRRGLYRHGYHRSARQ